VSKEGEASKKIPESRLIFKNSAFAGYVTAALSNFRNLQFSIQISMHSRDDSLKKFKVHGVTVRQMY